MSHKILGVNLALNPGAMCNSTCFIILYFIHFSCTLKLCPSFSSSKFTDCLYSKVVTVVVYRYYTWESNSLFLLSSVPKLSLIYYPPVSISELLSSTDFAPNATSLNEKLRFPNYEWGWFNILIVLQNIILIDYKNCNIYNVQLKFLNRRQNKNFKESSYLI